MISTVNIQIYKNKSSIKNKEFLKKFKVFN